MKNFLGLLIGSIAVCQASAQWVGIFTDGMGSNGFCNGNEAGGWTAVCDSSCYQYSSFNCIEIWGDNDGYEAYTSCNMYYDYYCSDYAGSLDGPDCWCPSESNNYVIDAEWQSVQCWFNCNGMFKRDDKPLKFVELPNVGTRPANATLSNVYKINNETSQWELVRVVKHNQ
ncbi:hypothetical protein BGW37DRAFT_476003 [Umbelopsis sp. PMI_123]|nr:hypothetical protein BGW37DRAFT_476003 [Umbelopsis sp. PMI_123]